MIHQQSIISIIIPVLNEAAIITENLVQLKSLLKSSENLEIIIVDGGSKDKTVELAKKQKVKVISSPSGRATQMNLGATQAKGDILLFLHADTLLPPKFDATIRKLLSQPSIVAGAFQLQIKGNKRSLRFIEKMVNLRSRFFSLPYGDQAIFLTAKVFQVIGGFPELPIMEDFVLVRNLQKLGKIAIAPTTVITSPRRWQKLGIWKTTLINQLIIIGYFLNISPAKLAKLYHYYS